MLTIPRSRPVATGHLKRVPLGAPGLLRLPFPAPAGHGPPGFCVGRPQAGVGPAHPTSAAQGRTTTRPASQSSSRSLPCHTDARYSLQLGKLRPRAESSSQPRALLQRCLPILLPTGLTPRELGHSGCGWALGVPGPGAGLGRGTAPGRYRPGCGPAPALMSARRRRPAAGSTLPRPLCSLAVSWPGVQRWRHGLGDGGGNVVSSV